MITDRAAFMSPPCPQCGAALEVEWCEVTSFTDLQPVYLPGRLTCPANEGHDVSAAYAELSWPPDLTDDDKVWLRTHTHRTRST